MPMHRNDLRDEDGEYASSWYRTRMGWDVHLVEGVPNLSFTRGVVGFLFPWKWFPVVAPLMSAMDVQGPVVGFLDVPLPRAVTLADANDCVFSQAEMPPGVTLLRAPARVPLPPKAGSRWLIAPDNVRRWLPSATAALAVLRTVVRTTGDSARPTRTAPRHQVRSFRR